MFLKDNTIIFRDHVFQGLKFRVRNDFKEEYFDELLEEGSHYSEVKYADGMDDQTMEDIHIKLSCSFLLKTISFVVLGIACFLLLNKLPLAAAISLVLSAILFTINSRLINKANEQYLMRETTRSIVSLVFNQNQKEKETESAKT